MHKTIATFDCKNTVIPSECHTVFNLGVKVIEKEFDTSILCEIKINATDSNAELRLTDATLQEWFLDTKAREIIVYKLSTHFKICLEQFAA